MTRQPLAEAIARVVVTADGAKHRADGGRAVDDARIEPEIADPPPLTGSALCVSCGLCCDGTIFELAPLRPDETVEPLQARGLTIVTHEAEHCIELPCSVLRGCRCHIYAERPSICRTYRCRVLRKYENGKLSWAEARARIDRAVMLRDSVNAELTRVAPGAAGTVFLFSIPPEQAALAADPELCRHWAPVLMRLALLRDWVITHFDPPPRPSTGHTKTARALRARSG